jgi:imidazolonepropionase-like amidohydrolase
MTETTYIKATWLWDGIHDKLIPDGSVLMEGGLIKKTGSSEELSRYPHHHAFHFPDATLMPGLIDSHTHLSMDPRLDNYLEHMSDPVSVLTLRATVMMRKDLHSGVTTCRCCGDREYLDIACRDAINHEDVEGPHLLVAARGIRAPHGHGFVGYPFEGVDQIRRAIEENAVKGADLTKIYITGTLRGDGRLPSYLSKDEIRTAIETTHQAGLRITAHCVGGVGFDWALESGIDSLEHGYHISDSQIEKLGETNTWLVLTPSPIMTEERVNHLPAELIPGHRKEKQMISERMAAVIASGIPFAVGTDGMHGELAQEIRYLIELGASPFRALQAATLNGARVSGIEHKKGSLESGKDADIIIVSGNPFNDQNNLNRIKAIWKSGKKVLLNSESAIK